VTYTANSMTSANPAADLYTAMASALTSAGFTLADTQVISTRTHKVWKSAAANNSQGLDWYLDVAYTTTGAGSVWLGAFENYSSPNGIRGPYNITSDTTTPDATTYSRYGATGSALETNWNHISSNIAQIQTTTSAYAYFISITGDRVIAMTSVAPTTLNYCGLFDMYTPWANKIGAAAYPLITCTVNTPSSINASAHSPNVTAGSNVASAASLTRRPPVATVGANGNFGGYGTALITTAFVDTTSGTSSGGGISAPLVPVDTGSSLFYDTARGGRLQIINSWPSSTGGGVAGSGPAIGLLKDVGIFAASAVTRGDTITISSATWVLSNTASNRCYGFKAA
jgi:hypothetical protein